MSTDPVTAAAGETVRARRQSSDSHVGTFRLADLCDVRWSERSGGWGQRCRPMIYGYVQCTQAMVGKVGHWCQHGQAPHRIKVVVLARDNSRAVMDRLRVEATAQRDQWLGCRLEKAETALARVQAEADRRGPWSKVPFGPLTA